MGGRAVARVDRQAVRLAPPEDLLVLERGADEILLCHPLFLQPVYMPKGRAFIKNLLSGVGKGMTRAELYANNQDHGALLQLLEKHHILENTAAAVRICPPPEPDGCHDRVVTYLTVTTACNLRCIYCLGGNKGHGRNPESMSQATACQAVERACQAVKPGGKLEVTFFGGEPLCNWSLVKAVGEYISGTLAPRLPDKSIALSMVSNLAQLPDDLVSWALEHGMSFLCDLDGPMPIHDSLRPLADGTGSWRQITENVKRLTAAGVVVGLRMTLTALNQSAMLETALLCKELGAKSCAFVPVQPVDIDGQYLAVELLPDIQVISDGLKEIYAAGVWAADELFPLNAFRDRMLAGGAGQGPGCGSFSGQTPVVNPDGKIYPCVYLAGDDRFCCGSAGNSIVNDQACLPALREQLLVENLPACRKCPWRSLCGGGCSVPRLCIEPDSKAPDLVKQYAREVNCAFTAAAYEILLWEQSAKAYAALAAKGR
jgi:uncharacterized protein